MTSRGCKNKLTKVEALLLTFRPQLTTLKAVADAAQVTADVAKIRCREAKTADKAAGDQAKADAAKALAAAKAAEAAAAQASC